MDVTEAKQRVRAEIERLAPTLIEVSHEIHENPELNFEEHFAHEMLTGVLTDEGAPMAPSDVSTYRSPISSATTLLTMPLPRVSWKCAM